MIIKYFIYQTDHFHFIRSLVSFISLLITRGTQSISFCGTISPLVHSYSTPLSQLSIHSLSSLGDQHDTKCTIDSLHKVYAPLENPYKVATESYHNCCASLKRSHDLVFLANVLYLNLLMSVYFGCPYTALSLSVTGYCTRALDQAIYSAFFSTSIFPLRTKALVVSQPVRQCRNAGNIEQMASPF